MKVAKILKSIFRRDTDIVARYGGEEFAIIMIGTELTQAQEYAAKLLDTIRQEKLAHAYSEISTYITASIGLATSLPSANDQFSHIIRNADTALYKARNLGRNQFAVADNTLATDNSEVRNVHEITSPFGAQI